MAVQLTIPYETLVNLIEQLPPDEQEDLLHRLQERTQRRTVSPEEWAQVFDSLKISAPVGENFSLEREDWYDDDRR